MELALSESMDCLLLLFPFTGSTGQMGFVDSFFSSEQDELLDVSEVYKKNIL